MAEAVNAETIAELAGEAHLPMPDGWTVGADSAGYPFQVINDDETAELLIFKSAISSDETVSNENELRMAVDLMINDVILTLPEAKLLTNTGYFDNNRASFVVEFSSRDTLVTEWISHRLKGVLYRHPDGHQMLFTLWARAPTKEYTFYKDQLRQMQEGFVYLGESEPDIFGAAPPSRWYLIATLLLLVAFMVYAFRRKRAGETIAFSDEAHFWRCECGRLNHEQYESCRRCGRHRSQQTTA